MRLHVRLEGIAAPETYQPGGRAAQARMHELVDGQLVTCSIPRAEESHDRLVGTCRLQDGRDLGGVMTGEGLARDCFAYSHGRYAATQAPAATALTLPSYCHEERRK
jgi:endonuclease YncB( thermonuclease family)